MLIQSRKLLLQKRAWAKRIRRRHSAGRHPTIEKNAARPGVTGRQVIPVAQHLHVFVFCIFIAASKVIRVSGCTEMHNVLRGAEFL